MDYRMERVIKEWDEHLKTTVKKASNNVNNSSTPEFQFMRGQIDAYKTMRLWWLDNSDDIIAAIEKDAKIKEPTHLNDILNQIAEFVPLDIKYFVGGEIHIIIETQPLSKLIRKDEEQTILYSLLTTFPNMVNRHDKLDWNHEPYFMINADMISSIEHKTEKYVCILVPANRKDEQNK